jgi:hypothetical protein
MTTGTPQHNLQVQANRESPIAAVALLAKNTGADGTTVAHMNWDADAEDGEALRGALRAAYTPFVSSAHVAQVSLCMFHGATVIAWIVAD